MQFFLSWAYVINSIKRGEKIPRAYPILIMESFENCWMNAVFEHNNVSRIMIVLTSLNATGVDVVKSVKIG